MIACTKVGGRSPAHVLILLVIALNAAEPQSREELLLRLDNAARSFQGARANIQVITHTEVVNEDETQTGTIAIKKHSSNDLWFLMKFTGQDGRQIALRGRTLQVYYPKMNTTEEYDIGKYQDLAQELTLLGFGMSGRDLVQHYEIVSLVTDFVESQKSTHLQLKPRAEEVLKKVSRIDLWISLETNCPVQQKFFLSGGDSRLVKFPNVRLNPRLPDSALDLPKSATKQRMN